MKRIIALLFATLMIAVLFSACGEKSNDATPDEAAVAETTVVLEYIADGGTLEQDPEGNFVTKDADGKVVSVEDKNGNPIDVVEYLETHSWVEGNPGGAGTKDASSAPDETTSDGDVLEGEIPVIMATFPDVEDQEELPDI